MARAVIILATGVATLLLGWLTVYRPFLGHPRSDVLSTPGLAGVAQRDEVPVPKGARACTRGVALPAGVNAVQYLLAGHWQRAPKVTLRGRVRATSFRGERGSVTPAGPDTVLVIPVDPPTSRSGTGSLCLQARQRGVSIVGTMEGRSTVVASTTVDNRATPVDPAVTLLGSRVLDNGGGVRNAPVRIEAATGFPAPLTWTIGVLAAVLLTLGTLGALAAAALRDGRA